MLYVILILFAIGILYPMYMQKIEKRYKAYFKECLDNDLYYPDTAYITENDMDPQVRADADKMLEIARKYVKNPEYDNEYLRCYTIGFETYKIENMDDLQAYLLKKHEQNMKDPDYARMYAKQRNADIEARMTEAFYNAKNAKPNAKIFRANYKKIVDRIDNPKPKKEKKKK